MCYLLAFQYNIYNQTIRERERESLNEHINQYPHSFKHILNNFFSFIAGKNRTEIGWQSEWESVSGTGETRQVKRQH